MLLSLRFKPDPMLSRNLVLTRSDELDRAKTLATLGKDLDNLTWAYNGNGTHTWETNQAFYRALEKATNGLTARTPEYTKAVKRALEELGKTLGSGEKLF